MYLAYLDESGTHNASENKYQVMVGVIIEGWEFRDIELAMGLAVEQLVPENRRDKFEEFHAYELFGGYGVFDGVEQEKRLGVVKGLLSVIVAHQVPLVYGAVDREKFADLPYRSADPVDICFNLCVEGIESWAATHIKMPAKTESTEIQDAQPLVVLVADDFPSKSPTKDAIRKSFRQLRAKVSPPKYDPGKTWHLHDDLYFGSSKESIGIQLSDLCAHIIRRHLEQDPSVAGFYDIIEGSIFSSQVVPETMLNLGYDANAKGQTA